MDIKAIRNAASHVTLVTIVDPVTRELYGTAKSALDETATLRRVSLFYRGTGRYVLTQEERDVSLGVLRARFAARYEAA
jgi:hypothetical protein